MKAMRHIKNFGLAVALMLVVVSNVGCSRIGPGYVGIKVNQAGDDRGVEEIPTTTGWVIYNPLASYVLEYPTFKQMAVWTRSADEGNPVNEEVTFTNTDSMQIAADINISYSLNPLKVPAFYVEFRNDDIYGFTHGYLRNEARDQLNNVAGKYKIEQIMGDNADFLEEVKQRLRDKLSPLGVEIDQFGFIGTPRPPEPVMRAINMKVEAVQKALQVENELASSKGEAQKRIAAAEGEAQSILAVARANAESNRILSQSITRELIELKQLEKWNGVMPQFTGGAMPFLNLTK